MYYPPYRDHRRRPAHYLECPQYDLSRTPSLPIRAKFNANLNPYRRPPVPQAPARTEAAYGGKKHRFIWIKKIGEGGFGRCDLFQKTYLDNRDRTKPKELLVYKQVSGEVAMYRDIPEEVWILKNIIGNQHDRICRLYDWSHSPKLSTFCFEYCSAGDLNGIIDSYGKRRLGIPEGFVWHTFIQLAEALAYIHSAYTRSKKEIAPPDSWKPVVHRDIKPGNVFLRYPGRSSTIYPDIVLGDFGIATTERFSCMDRFCGTLSFQGPEVPLHSREGDVWSMGACIHAMTYGGPPILREPVEYRGREYEWLKKPRARGVFPIAKMGYSYELEYAMLKTLKTDRERRPKARELVEDLEEWRHKSKCRHEPLHSWALKR
ncbi:MAG: hypothetical protein LQ351_003594 [Letrouitia transgressa]|nr:MAG: hypothetical protein LQ351_003594 [Letrouitia transgressa]